MAKIFDPNIEKVEKKSFGKVSFPIAFYITLNILVVAIVLIFMLVVREKKEESKNKNSMELVKVLEMRNENILTQKVSYVTSKKVDPNDTSDIFFEVVKEDKDIKVGDLVKFNNRFFEEIDIEGKKYCSLIPSQIQFIIRKKDVKENLLKRL